MVATALLDFFQRALRFQIPPQGNTSSEATKGVLHMGIVWTVLAIIGLIVVLQWLF